MKNLFTTLTIFFGLSTVINCQDFPDDFCLCEKQIIKSEILDQERILFVYLPDNYSSDTNRSYPVHYVADAPLTSNLYFNLLKLHSLMNYVPQSIVVGLSSDDRDINLHPNKGAEKYSEFIKAEVIPFINENYRTKDYRVLAGHSLSGDFTLYSFLNHTDLFDAYIAGSPGPIEPILKIAHEKETLKSTKDYKYLYSSIGSRDLTDSSSFNQLNKLIVDFSVEQLDIYFKINEGQNHISNMVINFQSGINQLYSNWQYQLPDVLEKSASQSIKEHYDILETKFGYRPEIGEWEVIYPTMDKLARRGDLKNAKDVLIYCTEIHPDSDQAYVFLAKVYFDTGDFENGRIYLDKSLELNPDNEFALRMKMMLEKQ